MKIPNYVKLFRTFLIVGAAIAGIMLTGCKKDSVTDPVSESGSISSDAAYSISIATGDESGGMTESYGDLLTVQSQGKINTTTMMENGATETVSSDSGTYNSVTGWWSVNITRSYTGLLVSYSYERNYQFKFWKNDTEFQQYDDVNGIPAVKMEFTIVSGTGFYNGLIVRHRLSQLQGTFLASNIDKDTVTITLEDNYIRTSIDSVITGNVTRTLSHSITIFKENTLVKMLRFRPTVLKPIALCRSELHKGISGTIFGHIVAIATVSRGDFYQERSIDQDFTVIFTRGNGKATINVGHNGDHGHFQCDLESGSRD